MVDDTIAQFEGIFERAPRETGVATVRDLFERVDVDSQELKTAAVWNATIEHGVNRSKARRRARSRSPAQRARASG